MMAGKVVGLEMCAVHVALGGLEIAWAVMIAVTTDTSQARETHMQRRPSRTPADLPITFVFWLEPLLEILS
jgi:hypothetical protein